jgi:intergrase/recombinase
MFYAIYFFQRYLTINKIKVSYTYIEHDIENKITLERKYLNNYISELNKLIGAVENDIDFKKNKTKLCNYCLYKTHCDNHD